jgi:hypothetical protein
MNKTVEEADKLRFEMERESRMHPSARTHEISFTPMNEISNVVEMKHATMQTPNLWQSTRRMIAYGVAAFVLAFVMINSLISLHQYCTSSKVQYIYVTTDCDGHTRTCPGIP